MGIIGMSDGPTATFTAIQTEEDREQYEAFLDDAARKISPCDRTFEQMLMYLEEKYQAIPYVLPERHLNSLKETVLRISFPQILRKTGVPEQELTREERIARYKEEKAFLREYPAERLGLEFRAYVLPEEPSEIISIGNGIPREQQASQFSEETRLVLEAEMKTQYMRCLNGGGNVLNDLILWRGVSQQDIDERSAQFVMYVDALKEAGKL